MNAQEFEDPNEMPPVARLVFLILLEATKHADQIYFERFRDADETGGRFAVSFEKHGVRNEYKMRGVSPNEIFRNMGISPSEAWQKILRRLKVLARTVDTGPNKSEDGQIFLRMSKRRTVEFHMTTNPNPYLDNKVTLINNDAKATRPSEDTHVAPLEAERRMCRVSQDSKGRNVMRDSSLHIAISANSEIRNTKDLEEYRARLERQYPGASIDIQMSLDPREKSET